MTPLELAEATRRARTLVSPSRLNELVQAQVRQRVEEERKELARRDELRDKAKAGDFAAFIRWAWPLAEQQPLTWGPHLDILADELQAVPAVYVPWMRDRVSNFAARLQPDGALLMVVCIPPGFAKSRIGAVLLPAFNWLFAPWLRSQYLSNNEDWAKRDSSRTRDIIKSPEYQKLADEISDDHRFKKWRIRKGEDENINYYNTVWGHRYSALLTSKKTTGGRAHIQVIDDPIDSNAVVTGSPAQVAGRCREAVDIIRTTLSSRGVVGWPFTRVMIAQRLADQDPPSWALAQGWRPVILPMRANPDLPKHCGGPHPLDKRPPGALLCPALKSEAEVQTLERSLGVHAHAQLGQDPRRITGNRLDRTWFAERYVAPPKVMAKSCTEVWISVDAAKKGKPDSDLHAAHVWGFRGETAILLARKAGRWGYPEFEIALDGLYAEWDAFVRGGPGGVLIEDTANGATYLQRRVGRVHNLTPFLPSQTPGTDKSKAARFVYFERKAQARQILLPCIELMPDVEIIIDLWEHFTGADGGEDDDCDAASQLFVHHAIEAAATVERQAFWGWRPDPRGVR